MIGGMVIFVRTARIRPWSGLAGHEHVRSVLRVAPGSIVEVGEHHEVADRREPPGHVVELLPDPRRVHQEEHGRARGRLAPAGR